MAVTYTWAVVQMDAYPEYDGETDVVFNVHWTLTGAESGYQSYLYGSQSVTLDSETPFTPFDDLTEEQVLGWVFDAMGAEQVASYEATAAAQVADLINPPVVTPPLPWSAP